MAHDCSEASDIVFGVKHIEGYADSGCGCELRIRADQQANLLGGVYVDGAHEVGGIGHLCVLMSVYATAVVLKGST